MIEHLILTMKNLSKQFFMVKIKCSIFFREHRYKETLESRNALRAYFVSLFKWLSVPKCLYVTQGFHVTQIIKYYCCSTKAGKYRSHIKIELRQAGLLSRPFYNGSAAYSSFSSSCLGLFHRTKAGFLPCFLPYDWAKPNGHRHEKDKRRRERH